AEDDDVAALGLARQHPSLERREPERERPAAVAVAELRDEDEVADQQRRDHRARRDRERLEGEGADDDRDRHRPDDRLDRLDDAAGGAAREAGGFLLHHGNARAPDYGPGGALSSRAPGAASISTIACATGGSSVSETWMRGAIPAGTSRSSAARAPPASRMVGWPE